MTTLSIDLSDEAAERVSAAFAAAYPMPDKFEGTGLDWVKDRVSSFINEVTVGAERNAAVEAARVAAEDTISPLELG